MRAMCERTCKGCGRTFTVREAEVKRGNGRFCSKRCRLTGEGNPSWKGGVSHSSDGYVSIRTEPGRHVREHVVVAERALGHRLPLGAEVHHFNENRSDNRNRNLVICQDVAYHRLLHMLRRRQLAGKPIFQETSC